MLTVLMDVDATWEQIADEVIGAAPPRPIGDDHLSVVLPPHEDVAAVMAWIAERRIAVKSFHRVEVEYADYETRSYIEGIGFTFLNVIDIMVFRMSFSSLTDDMD